MSVSLIKKCWTTKDIAEDWKKQGKVDNVSDAAEDIATRFSNILNGLNLSEGRAWYKTKSNSPEGGYYIFLAENVPTEMENLFKIWEDKKGIINLEEKYELIRILTHLLPLFRKIDELDVWWDYQMVRSDRSSFGLKKDVDQRRDSIIKILAKKYKMNREELERELEVKVFDTIYDIWDKNKGKIVMAVNRYYIETRNAEFFRERIFVGAKRNELKSAKKRKELYEEQNKQIEEWKKKWLYIIENMRKIRIIERKDNVYWTCDEENIPVEDEKKFYETGETQNKVLADICLEQIWIPSNSLYKYFVQKYRNNKGEMNQDARNNNGQKEMNRDVCKEKCSEFVNEFLKKNESQTFKEDFDYVIYTAFEELESIGKEIGELMLNYMGVDKKEVENVEKEAEEINKAELEKKIEKEKLEQEKAFNEELEYLRKKGKVKREELKNLWEIKERIDKEHESSLIPNFGYTIKR